MHREYEVTSVLKDQEVTVSRTVPLIVVLGLAFLILWSGLVLFAFFGEHPFAFDFFLRLVRNFSIPLEIVPGKLLPAAKHIVLSLLLTGTSILSGRLLLRICGVYGSSHSGGRWDIVEHITLAFGLGLGLFMYAIFLLGVLGALYPQAFWLLMLAILSVCFYDARNLSRDLHLLFAREEGQKSSVISRLGLAAFWLVIVSLLVVALAPSITHDAMVYHLNVPRLYANSHRIVPIPYNLFSNTVLNMEMLYTLALSVDDFILANLLHFSIGLAGLLALYGFTRKKFGITTARLAVLILFFNPLILSEISIAYVDLSMMFYFLLMMISLWNWRTEGNDRWFLLFCIFAGIFAGIKYTALHGLLAAGIVIISGQLFSQKREVRGLLRRLIIFGGVVSVLVLPYLIKNCVITGNPVYPLMYDIFGGKWLSPHQVERMLAYVNSHGMGHDWKHLVALPWNITVSGSSGFNRFDAVITPLWLIFVPVFLIMRRKPSVLKWAFFVCAVYFASWAASTHITRYLLPIFPLLSLISAYVIVSLEKKIAALSDIAGKAFAGITGAICAFIWLTFSFFYPLRAPSEFGAVIWGKQSRDEFLTKIVPSYSAFKYINENLPQNAYFAFFWDNRGFFCDRRQIGDSVFEAPSMLEIAHEAGSAHAFHQKLRSMGINYVLFNDLFYSNFPPFATSPEDKSNLAQDLKILKEFREGYCIPFFSADGTELYAVHY